MFEYSLPWLKLSVEDPQALHDHRPCSLHIPDEWVQEKGSQTSFYFVLMEETGTFKQKGVW